MGCVNKARMEKPPCCADPIDSASASWLWLLPARSSAIDVATEKACGIRPTAGTGLCDKTPWAMHSAKDGTKDAIARMRSGRAAASAPDSSIIGGGGE